MQVVNLGQLINVTSFGNTYPAASAPVFLKPVAKAISNTLQLNLPGSGALFDVVGIEATALVKAQSGTSPTLTLKIQGSNDIAENQTTLSAAVLTTDTSLSITSRTGMPQYGYLLLMSSDGTNYEWVQVTSAAATGAGTHTVTRALFGTSAKAFANTDNILFTTGWVDIPSNNATTTTLTSAAVSITSATVTAPVPVTVSSQGLNMSSIDFPIVRVVGTLGGTIPTASFTVNASVKTRSKFDVSK